MSRPEISWTVGPALLATLFLIATSLWMPGRIALDTATLIEQVALALALVSIVIGARQFMRAGWRNSSGFAWIWLAGPLWLGVLTPIGLALANATAHPMQTTLWVATSLLVGLNEETIFRGFLLGGLNRHKGPLLAAILSSLAFGLLHGLNGLVGADPIFLAAQMIVAMGSGLALAAVTLRAGSIWPAVFIHFAVDAVGLTALGGFESAIQTPEMAPGMIIGGILFGAWGVFWIWWLDRRGRLGAGQDRESAIR